MIRWGSESVNASAGCPNKTSLPITSDPIGEELSAPAKPVEMTTSHDSPSKIWCVMARALAGPIPV